MKIEISLSGGEIDVYRLEHSDSKLGPFVHGGQISEVVNKGIHATKRVMDDIDELPEVKKILTAHPEAIFGFTSEQKCASFIRNKDVLDKHGFTIVRYHVEPLFVARDGQVVFVRP